MHDWQSLSHVRWDCKYHVVIIPKYRKRKLYGKFKRKVAEILKDLCRQRGVVNGLLELSHFRSSDLSHILFYSEAHSLPPLSLCLGGGSYFL